jgi:signal peptidase
MSVSGPIERASRVAGGTLPFVEARFAVAPVPALAASGSSVAFQVRGLGTNVRRPLTRDPAIAPPLSFVRVVANAGATFVLLLAAGLALLAAAPRFIGYEPVVVTSGSMQPAIDVGDVVVTTPSDGGSLGEGAVINFELEDGTRLHRIVEVTDAGYRTAGDANANPDSDLVAAAQVRGIGTVVVPFAGLPSLWSDTGRWPLLLVAVAILTACLYVSRAAWVEPESSPWT